MSDEGTISKNPLPGEKTSVRLGLGYLKPVEEAGHYGVFRDIITKDVATEEVKSVSDQPIGPLFVYRKCAKDELEDVWTLDETTGLRIGLVLVWDAREPDKQIAARKRQK